MYGAFNKERKGDIILFQYDQEISLFGKENGWIPWLLEMATPKEQDEPYRWHLHIQTALAMPAARPYARKANSTVINIKPGSDELFLCELIDVWGFSSHDWTPMLWHLRVLEPQNTKCTANRFQDFTSAEDGDQVYEFIYAKGTVKEGNVYGSWLAPKSSPTNGALLWPEPLDYFLECIKG